MGTRADNGELVGTFGDFGITSLPDACGSIMGFLELGFSSSKCTLPAAQSHDPPLEVLSPTATSAPYTTRWDPSPRPYLNPPKPVSPEPSTSYP